MIKIETLEVSGLVPAMMALRLPYSKEPRSWKHRTKDEIQEYDYEYIAEIENREYINKDDLALASKLVKAGDCHAKAVRGVVAYVSISAPRYWWQEFVTYRHGSECLSSTSTMHTIAKGVTPDMFDCPEDEAEGYCSDLNALIDAFNATKETQPKETCDDLFYGIKRRLPECFIQTRIFAISYQCLRNMWIWRANHRLQEWHQFCDWIATLPFADKLILV